MPRLRGCGRRIVRRRGGMKMFPGLRLVPTVRTFGTGRRVRRRGGNIFSKIGNWIKGAANTVYQKAIKPAGQFIKDNKLVSKGLSLIPGVGGKVGSVIAGQLGVGRRRTVRRKRRVGGSFFSNLGKMGRAATHGLGRKRPKRRVRRVVGKGFLRNIQKYLHQKAGKGRRKRVVRRRRVGGSIRSFLKSAHSFVKKHQLVSKALHHVGMSNLAKGAHSMGYGRAPKRRRARRIYRRRR